MERSDSVDSLEDLLNNLNDDSDESFTEKEKGVQEKSERRTVNGKTSEASKGSKQEDGEVTKKEDLNDNPVQTKNEEIVTTNGDFEETSTSSETAIDCCNLNVKCDNQNLLSNSVNKLLLQSVTESESSDSKEVKSRSHSICSHLEDDVINQFLDKTTENVGVLFFSTIFYFTFLLLKRIMIVSNLS